MKYKATIIFTLFFITFFSFIASIPTLVHMTTEMMAEEQYYDEYEFLTNTTKSTLVIFPSFTKYAYMEESLVDYKNQNCKTETETEYKLLCHTITIYPLENQGGFGKTGSMSYRLLSKYFNYTNDWYVSTLPNELNNYDKLIIMKNEYVTKIERDAILQHPNVIYLYPDALTKQVTLIQEIKLNHAPSISIIDKQNKWNILQDFDYIHPDAEKWKDDYECTDWEFIQVKNGYMLNCNPEAIIMKNFTLLKKIKDL